MTNLMTPKELNEIGDQYFYGNGVDKNIEVAFTYYKRAADQNNPVGLANVGKYFLEKQNGKQALVYYQKSAELDYSLAFIKLSDMFLNGIGVKKNKKKAFKYLESAVKLNEVDAYHQLGQFYLLGIGCKKSEEKAYELFDSSAQSNHTEGMYQLGHLLINGKKIKKDDEAAFFYLDKAATNNNVNAINYLKELYRLPHSYLKKKSDLTRMKMWFFYDEILAGLDDVDALRRCAFDYYNGTEVVGVNFDKSIKYFKVLHGLDHVDGYLGMGLSYLYGYGVTCDLERAQNYLEIASNRGSSKAKNALGDMYRLGKGVEVDYNRARDYYLEAAKDNEEDALINLGLLHYRKQIKNANDTLALQFMTRASEKNSAAAFYWLGIFSDKGIGQNRSFDSAVKFFEKAIVNGNVGAKYKLAQLLYDQTQEEKMPKRKKDKQYLDIRDLLLEYIENPLSQDVNVLYSLYLLGDLFSLNDFSEASDKRKRYFYESAAEKGFSKAMVKMFDILSAKEPQRALFWLEEACKKPTDGEEYFQMGLIYNNGLFGKKQDKVMAQKYFTKAAELNHKEALIKLSIGN
ncbi:MAG: SEL1-like repeat protein [Candidatus Izemoplasmatales bacterium]|nr:SEL1-like repeat protein [Candidatus Izemoplasmatales bacterium]